ncbi:hypothetical protein LSAT2_001019, partial [Lamellibrachia satsuma]
MLVTPTVLVFLLALCTANMERHRGTRGPPNESIEQRCEVDGGSCISRWNCHDHSNVIAFFCRRPYSVCCVSKKRLCENAYKGFCTDNVSECQPK